MSRGRRSARTGIGSLARREARRDVRPLLFPALHPQLLALRGGPQLNTASPSTTRSTQPRHPGAPTGGEAADPKELAEAVREYVNGVIPRGYESASGKVF